MNYLFTLDGFAVFEKDKSESGKVVRLIIVDTQRNNSTTAVDWSTNLQRFIRGAFLLKQLVDVKPFYNFLKNIYPPLPERKKLTEIPEDIVGLLLETQGFEIYQRAPRSDWGTVLLLFKRGEEIRQVGWMSFEQRLWDTKTGVLLDELIDLRPVYEKLRELFPKTGYFFDDPELREMLGGKPAKRVVSSVSE